MKGKKEKQQKLSSWWKCSLCGFTIQAKVPPEKCPSCLHTCAFSDVTCYHPECGGPINLDPGLVGRDKK